MGFDSLCEEGFNQKSQVKHHHRSGSAPQRTAQTHLFVHELPLSLLLRAGEVLDGRVVRLGVSGRLGLGRGDRVNVLVALVGAFRAPQVKVVLLLLLLGRVGVLDPAVADRVHEPHHLLGLPLGRNEPPLGLERVAQHLHVLLDRRAVVLVRVERGVRELALADAVDDVEFFVGQHDLAVVHRVVDRAHRRLGVVHTRQEGVHAVAVVLARDRLAVHVVADVLLVLVPLERHVADAVQHAVVLGRVALFREVVGFAAAFVNTTSF